MPRLEKAPAAPPFSSCTRRPPIQRPSATCWKSYRREAMPDETPGAEILNLGQDFPPVPTEVWEAAIQKDLKGADYEKKLVWRTDEGLAIRPYYRRENLAGLEAQTHSLPGRFPFVRGSGKRWKS